MSSTNRCQDGDGYSDGDHGDFDHADGDHGDGGVGDHSHFTPTTIYQVELKQSSTPILLAVRRRGDDERGRGDGDEVDEVMRRKRREEEERAFTSLPNPKLRRQR